MVIVLKAAFPLGLAFVRFRQPARFVKGKAVFRAKKGPDPDCRADRTARVLAIGTA
jgi:hypothetical protein